MLESSPTQLTVQIQETLIELKPVHGHMVLTREEFRSFTTDEMITDWWYLALSSTKRLIV
uniref:Uncharacterized protein n=1 Tax=Nelumbo nucifera TaxID=4432 RepID=A0A822YA07_NELNU|nr:TPA_asm: hypothetical protein HUJ06_029567 [Nelumbo nucifera]